MVNPPHFILTRFPQFGSVTIIKHLWPQRQTKTQGRNSTYVTQQETHHGVGSFQEELRKLLDAHGIAYDERYV